MGRPVTPRLQAWVHQMLIAVDQLVGCWLRGWIYVWCGGELPSPDETISSWVGRHSLLGNGRARILERFIDAIFGTGHCRRSIGS
jgi:hypothetical protein